MNIKSKSVAYHVERLRDRKLCVYSGINTQLHQKHAAVLSSSRIKVNRVHAREMGQNTDIGTLENKL